MILINLIAAEFIAAAFGIPVELAATINHGWKFGRMFCEVTGFLLTLSGK